MNSKRKEELIEQYDDAVIALLMDEYAEQEGNRLLREYEEALANGEVPEVPAELDARCRKTIQQAYSRQRRKASVIRFCKSLARVAVIALVVLGLCTTLVLSVEALRIPVLNFIFGQTDQYTSFGNTNETQPNSQNESTSSEPQRNTSNSPLNEFLSDDFYIVTSYSYDDGAFLYYYKNNLGATVTLSAEISDGLLNSDTEGATRTSISIGGYEGFYIEKEAVLIVLWFDSETNMLYKLQAANMTDADFWILAVALIDS